MKKLFLTLSLAFACTVMFAVPAKRGQWKTVKLANGQEVRVELRGDEFCKFWQTADGLKLVENPKTGFYEKADMKRMTAKAAELSVVDTGAVRRREIQTRAHGRPLPPHN